MEPATVDVICPHCSVTIGAPPDTMGTTQECPACSKAFALPALPVARLVGTPPARPATRQPDAATSVMKGILMAVVILVAIGFLVYVAWQLTAATSEVGRLQNKYGM